MKDEPKQYHALWMHREMLYDRVRCGAYRTALRQAVKPGHRVLDMGAGTGILSMFAAQAGAAVVYAVERTAIADVAQELINRNGFAKQIVVVRGDMDDVNLPTQVDVIVSEWMGGFGVDENLLPPLVRARERWLAPGGRMLPATVRAWIAPVQDDALSDLMSFWRSDHYGLDLGLIGDMMTTEIFNARHSIVPDTLVAPGRPMWSTDTRTVTLAEAEAPFEASHVFEVERDGTVSGLAAWFDADFGTGVVLSNAPESPKTHWGRSVMPLCESLRVRRGDRLEVRMSCIPAGPNLCDNRWAVRLNGGRWMDHVGRQGCTPSPGFH